MLTIETAINLKKFLCSFYKAHENINLKLWMGAKVIDVCLQEQAIKYLVRYLRLFHKCRPNCITVEPKAQLFYRCSMKHLEGLREH